MDLLLPYAYNEDGNLVHISHAQKGDKYTCPNCESELLLRISKIPEGQKYHRRNHFAHKGSLDNHCSESFLHKLFKNKCTEFIQKRISDGKDFCFEWNCKKCNEKHKGNLLKKAVKIVTEYDLGLCKPDIALLDCNDNVIIVIEIIVTHKPTLDVLQYYEDNKIACLQIKVEDFSDCEHIDDKLAHPDSVNLCPNPICEKCGSIMHNAKIVTVITDCWKCGNMMTVAMMFAADKRIFSPIDFNEEELEIAKTLGANIKKRYSKTVNDTYLANVCEHCNAFVGDFYLHDYYDIPHSHEIDLDYKCFNCIEEAKELEYQAELEKQEILMELKSNEGSKFCPKCGGVLRVKTGYRGPFWGCENYPNCNHTEDLDIHLFNLENKTT